MGEYHSCTEPNYAPSPRELEVILNSTHDAMIAVNASGIIHICNTAAEKLLHLAARDVLGHPIEQVIANSRLEVVLKTGVPELNQQQTVGDVTVITNRVPVRDTHNIIIGAAAVFRDITEVKHLAEEITNLKEVQEMLEAIINSSQEAISVVDETGRIILVNPEYTRLIGMPKEELLGKSPTVDIQQGESMHLQTLRTGQPVRGIPMRAGPQNREIIVNAAPIVTHGRLRGSVAVAHDVSELKHLNEELDRMKSLVRRLGSRYTFDDIIGTSPAIRNAVDQAEKASATPATILLTGESGVGKELFAHAIHHASPRKYHPFIRVNCAAIPETLLESELFGYEEGAFTGARRGGKKGLFLEAQHGTIFLDEIGELTLPVQAKLLRVLQEKEIIPIAGRKSIRIDVRVIGATNMDLPHAIHAGAFREDLFYRINVFPIVIPPLRERSEDILHLTVFLLRKLNQEYGRNVLHIAPDALACLQQYSWPGNIRELENVIGRALIHMKVQEDTIHRHHLPALTDPHTPLVHFLPSPPPPSLRSLSLIMEEAESQALQQAIEAAGGNREQAAKILGISLRSLYYKLERHHI